MAEGNLHFSIFHSIDIRRNIRNLSQYAVFGVYFYLNQVFINDDKLAWLLSVGTSNDVYVCGVYDD